MFTRTHLRFPQLAAGIALLGLLALGCEDPLAKLKQAKLAPSSGAATPDVSDDEEAKARVGGITLGPDHVSRRLYYQFVDHKGRVRFVERLDEVPEQWRERVGFVEMDTPPPLSPMMAQATRDAKYSARADKIRQQRLASRRANRQIILYSADWCGWCKEAKRHLDARGVKYVIRDIDKPKYLSELMAKTGQKGIPVLDVGGRIVTGFSPERYDELIRGAA